MKKRHPVLNIILAIISGYIAISVVVMLALFIIGLIIVNEPREYYETTDAANYGSYIGNYDNETPSEYINSFFPKKIDDSFADVEYVYHAKKFDVFAFEAFLEFSIRDTELFVDYVESITEESNWKPFRFDSNYMEFSIDDALRISFGEEQPIKTYIEEARIGKVLYSQSEQRIIFVAIGVYDGGGTKTEELNAFFDRFNIDPAVYAETADEAYFQW